MPMGKMDNSLFKQCHDLCEMYVCNKYIVAFVSIFRLASNFTSVIAIVVSCRALYKTFCITQIIYTDKCSMTRVQIISRATALAYCRDVLCTFMTSLLCIVKSSLSQLATSHRSCGVTFVLNCLREEAELNANLKFSLVNKTNRMLRDE